MQNIFIVPGIQNGRRAKPLYVKEVENNTWARGDMKFIFECSDFEIEHDKINFISPSSHVLFYLLYKFRSIISKGEYSKGLTIRISGHVFDTISEHMCSDTTFLSGQNPYNTLSFI